MQSDFTFVAGSSLDTAALLPNSTATTTKVPHTSPSSDVHRTTSSSNNNFTSLYNNTKAATLPSERVVKHYTHKAIVELLLWRPRGVAIPRGEGYKLQRLAVRRLREERRRPLWTGGGDAYTCQCQQGYQASNDFTCEGKDNSLMIKSILYFLLNVRGLCIAH